MHEALSEAGPPVSSPWYVLLALRRSNRILVDADTGRIDEVISAFQALRVPLKVVEVGSLNADLQVRLFSEAAVTVAVHGGDCTNIAFMPRRAHLIEVTLRYGWCCHPVPPEALDDGTKGFSGVCRSCKNSSLGCDYNFNDCKPYHKADYFNQAWATNLTWSYFDPEYLNPTTGRNLIDRDYVFVNSTGLALAALHYYRQVIANTRRSSTAL